MNDSPTGPIIPPSNQSTPIPARGNASACSASPADPEPATPETRSTVVASSRICRGTITAVTNDDNMLARNSALPALQHSAIPRATNRTNATTFIVPSTDSRRHKVRRLREPHERPPARPLPHAPINSVMAAGIA